METIPEAKRNVKWWKTSNEWMFEEETLSEVKSLQSNIQRAFKEQIVLSNHQFHCWSDWMRWRRRFQPYWLFKKMRTQLNSRAEENSAKQKRKVAEMIAPSATVRKTFGKPTEMCKQMIEKKQKKPRSVLRSCLINIYWLRRWEWSERPALRTVAHATMYSEKKYERVVHPMPRTRQTFIMRIRTEDGTGISRKNNNNYGIAIVYIRNGSIQVVCAGVHVMSWYTHSTCQSAARKYVFVWMCECVHGRRKQFSRSATNTLILSFGCRRRCRRCCCCRQCCSCCWYILLEYFSYVRVILFRRIGSPAVSCRFDRFHRILLKNSFTGVNMCVCVCVWNIRRRFVSRVLNMKNGAIFSDGRFAVVEFIFHTFYAKEIVGAVQRRRRHHHHHRRVADVDVVRFCFLLLEQIPTMMQKRSTEANKNPKRKSEVNVDDVFKRHHNE